MTGYQARSYRPTETKTETTTTNAGPVAGPAFVFLLFSGGSGGI